MNRMKETLRHLSWASAMLMKKAADGLPQKRFHQIILSLVVVLAFMPAVNVQAFTILTQSETYTDGMTQVFTYNGYSYQVTYTNLKGITKVNLSIIASEIDLEDQNNNAFTLFKNNISAETTANAITTSDLPKNIGTSISCYRSAIANDGNNPVVTIECVHLVKFDANGGSGTMNTMAYDATAKNLTQNSFTRTGYTFSGWATTATGTKAYDDKASYTATGDVTLYAVWTANQYAVTLDSQSATTAGTTSVTATYDADMPTLTTLPVKTGYTFGGYYSGTNGSGTQYYKADGTSTKAICDLTSNITLYAKWLKNPIVTLNYKNGSATVNQTVDYGTKFAQPTDPTMTGYTFGGWYASSNFSGSIFNFTAALTSDVTLYAKWTANQYTVTLDDQSPTTAGQGSVNATYDAAMPQLTTLPAKTGYTFGGYYSEINGGGTLYYKADGTSATAWNITSATTLYAKWTAIQYTITWKNEDGTTLKEDKLDYGTTISYNGATPTKTAQSGITYTFNGWSPALTEGTTVTGDATYTATYILSIGLSTRTINGATYYEIAKKGDWDVFSAAVNSLSPSINGILTADINLGTDQTMIGTSNIPYAGIFDGNGKTLYVSYSGSADMIAPFSVVNGATIRNLKVDGTVTSTSNYASGLVGAASSAVLTISNCEVSSGISSPYCGGFIGHGQTPTPTITNSIFSGSLTATAYSGCFVGWEESTCKITIQNCLSVPSAISGGTSNDFVTLNGGTANVNNSYSYGTFTSTQGTAEDETTMKGGKIARLLNGGDGTTENATSVWGQVLGTDTHPVFMTANDANAVYCVTVNNTKSYGNANSTIALPAGNLTFNDTKIITTASYTDGTATYMDTYTLSNADKTLTYVANAEDNMSTHTETGTDGKTYYQISTPAQMKWFEYYVNKSADNVGTCAKLMNDINLSSICSATAGNWTPIAPNDDWYTGTFDGNGKTISNLYINNATTNNQGLFGEVGDVGDVGGTIKDLNVTGNVTGLQNVALLVGYSSFANIIRCTSSGTVSGNSWTGGIVGYNSHGNIIQCVNNATVNDESDPTGGIAAADCNNGSIIDCVNFGTVKTKKNDYTSTGGIVGQCVNNSIISNNLNMGQVYVADVLTEAYPILGTDKTASTTPSTVTDNYYLSASTTAASYGTPKTAAEIAATATMASLLQGSQTDEEYWIADPTQTAYPMLKCFAKAAQVTKSDNLAATYYNTLAWTIPSGMKVYTVNSATSGFANATEYTTGTVVPAGTAVVISGAAGDYQLNFDRTSAVSAVSGNLLRGSDLSATTAGDDATKTYSFYKLSLDANGATGSLGFYYGATGGVAFTSNAHKAYLPISSQGGTAKGYILSFGDEPTGISSLPDDTTESGAWYTISGIRLNGKPTTGGLYINNGKKIIIK